MLTRLYVDGFKNLVKTDIAFGPLTCIAGPNGVGKSNLFDAISFLSLLAEKPFAEAARTIRGGDDFEHLFTSGGDRRMHFRCDLIIPATGKDSLNRQRQATQTFLTYELILALEIDDHRVPSLKLEHESLVPTENRLLHFPLSQEWLNSVSVNVNESDHYVWSERAGNGLNLIIISDEATSIAVEESGKSVPIPSRYPAKELTNTLLSYDHGEGYPTVFLTREEMKSWRSFLFEPSALRRSDRYQDQGQLASNGGHLPATIYRLAQSHGEAQVYATLANRVSQILNSEVSLRVDRDDVRRLSHLMLKDRSRVPLPAASISDGTLRFLALAVLELDDQANGVFCFDEPENGIHPQRIWDLVSLMQGICLDTSFPLGDGNSLRQVIITTHSPVMAVNVNREDLVFADLQGGAAPGNTAQLQLRPVQGTWRESMGYAHFPKGNLRKFMATMIPDEESENSLFQLIQDRLVVP